MDDGTWSLVLQQARSAPFPAADEVDTDSGIDDVHAGLQTVAARPWGLVGKTAVARSAA